MKKLLSILILLALAQVGLAQTYLNNVQIGASSSSLSVGASDETGSTIYTNVTGVSQIFFDQDSGLYVELLPNGDVRVYSGSHWYGIGAGGETNSPTGAQDIQFAVSTEVEDITWNTNTTPWTLTWPNIPGPQGEQGDPGFTFAVYNSTGWSTSESYETNQWFLYGGDGYGVLENFIPTAGTTPPDYTLSGELLLLYTSGEDGADGENGAGMIPSGNWSASIGYPSMASVRYGDAWYYTLSASSNQTPGVSSNWNYYIGDGSAGAASIVTSNAVWSGRFDYTLSYPSNSIVYYPENPYGGYRVVKYYEEAVGGLPGPVRLSNTEYFKKLWHYARDGSAGSPGEDGQQGADGAGNMWYRAAGWDDEFEFTNAGIVVVHNDETYISKAYSLNKEPGVVSGWTNYWKVGAGKGVSGGLYKWSLGYDNAVQYTNYDVVVESNIAWLCTSPAQAEPPWLTPGKWEDMFTPGYVTLAQITTRNYSQYGTYTNGEIVNYGGGAYLCTNAVTNTVSSSPASDYFYYWIRKGDQGPQGPAGTTTVVYTNLVVSTCIVQQITQEYQGIELTNDLNASGFTISNAVFQGDGSGLTGIDAGGATNIQAGASDSYNPTTRTLMWDTNAVQTGGGGTLTNETDPVWSAASTGYYTIIQSDSIFATGTPLYVESDPIFANWQANTFTDVVEALIASEAVTGAVTKITTDNGEVDGNVTFANATNDGNTVYIDEVDQKLLDSLEGYEADYYVAKWGDDSNAGTNWSAPFASITQAVTTGCSSIYVHDGTYSGKINITNTLTLMSVNGTRETFITGNDITQCVYCVNDNIIVDGFTIEHGYDDVINGGAAGAHNGKYLNCVIRYCSVDLMNTGGSGAHSAYLYNSEIHNCTNKSGGGPGGLYSCTVYDSYIHDNAGYSQNAGAKNTTFYNCTTRDNNYLPDGTGQRFNYGFGDCTFYDSRLEGYRENRNSDLVGSSWLNNDAQYNAGNWSFYAYGANGKYYIQDDLTVSGDIKPTSGNYFTFPSGSYFDDDGTNLYYVGAETSQLNKVVFDYDGTNFYQTINGTNYYVQVSTNKPTY